MPPPVDREASYIAAVRRRAWETRRERYGASGHTGPYRQVARCPRCKENAAEIDRLRRILADHGIAETVTRETAGSESVRP